MAIPSQQIGWSQRAKLLWQISKQIERLTQVMGNVTCPECTTTTSTSTSTTTTTTTAGLFSGTISYGTGGVCSSPEGSFAVTGNAANFCDCTELYGTGFESLIGISTDVLFGSQFLVVTINGTSTAMVQAGGCIPC